MNIKGVIFDLDGVITDTAKYHYMSWKVLSKSINIDIDIDFNEKLKGVSRIESLDLILKKGNKQNYYLQKEKEKMLNYKNSLYLDFIKELSSKDILDGIEDFLCELDKKSIKKAIASASKNAKTILNYLGLINKFDYIVDVNKIKNNKPSPDIFLDAANTLNLELNYLIGIEDSVSGIEALNKANIKSVGIGDRNILKNASLVIDSTKKLSLEFLGKNII